MTTVSPECSTGPIEIDDESLGIAVRAVEQPGEEFARVRIRDGHLEFACMDERLTMLCESRVALEGNPTDSAEFEIDRRAVEHLSARVDGSIQIRADREMLAFRAGDHIYSTIARAEGPDVPVPSPDTTARLDVTDVQFRRLTEQIDAPHIVFETEDEDLWLSGHSLCPDMFEGSVRVPSESVDVLGEECYTIVNGRFVARCLLQLPAGADCTVLIGTDEPIWIVSTSESVEMRHVIAPRVHE